MANPILKTDLITDDALRALEEMSRLLREDKENMDALMASFKQYAGSIQTATSASNGNNDALAAALQKVSELEKAYSDLQKAMKENAATQKAINAEKRKYAKLTEEEAAAVRSLAQGWDAYAEMVKKGHTVTLRNKEDIDIQNKSYNELYQTYNALKDALNKLTIEQRTNTDVGKYMTAQALKIRDTMNEMQKATGNYTLQVGKYRAAFDGLGYSFQQILREAPSALNLNQFFLAISNNIPQFLDQLKAFQAEQAEIKANLDTMTKGTKEYAEQLAKVETVGKKLGRTLMSWQTLVLVGLMIIRNWDRIVSGISNLFSNLTREAKALMNVNQGAASTVGELTAKYKALQKEWNNLKEQDKGEWIKQHQNDWNELGISINNATDAENLYVKNTSTVQNAIDARARSIAAMKIASEKYEEAFRKQAKAEQDLASGKMGFWRSAALSLASAGMAEGTGTLNQEQQAWQEGATKESIQSYYEQQMKAVKKLQEEAQYYITTWVLPDPLNPTKNGSKGKQPSEQSTSDRYWEAEQELLEKMKTGYGLERALAKLNRDKERDELVNWYVDQKLALDENLKNGFISQAKYDADIQELDRENATLREGINRKYWDKINQINREEAEKALKAREDRTIREINAITAVELKASSKRVRNTAQEAAKNNVLVENLNRLLNARKELIALDIASDETRSIEERTKALEKLNKEISKYASQLDFSKRLGTYSSLSDMITKNINVSGGNKKSILTNIIGEDAMKTAAESLGEGFEDWVDGQFETWMNSATQAVSTWYNNTMGYINDLISAYVELANAKAEAAAEATEAAQEEYDKEKALLEAGYANRVETTWAEYQEKKAAQEKAEADAKAAAQAQKELNEMQTAGSMIVAAANIWKTFSGMGPVGIALAAVATAGMFAAFVASKAKAAEVSKYGEGGFEVLEGGSHASGHDIDLGVNNRKGRRMRAEGKEGLGIFSRKAMAHYGASNIEAMVNSVNRMEFEGNAAKRMSIERSVGMAVLSAPRTDLHKLENSVDKLVSYGSRSRTVNADGSVTEYRKNGKVTIKKG